MCSVLLSELTCWNVTHSEQTHTRVSIHSPLLSLTVGLAAVVHEAGVVPFRAGIDDPVLRTQRSIGSYVDLSSYLDFKVPMKWKEA